MLSTEMTIIDTLNLAMTNKQDEEEGQKKVNDIVPL